jgi:L-asparaginase II
MDRCNPVMVEVTRGERVESRHRGSAAVVDAEGAVVAAWGDIALPVFPRSAVKPLQALPLLETGAAERFGVSDEEIALACGSHGGEPEHVQRVDAWLARIGLTPAVLVCGPHPPLSAPAARDVIRQGEELSPLHNNCSGKHAGFLTTAVHLGEPVTGYAGSVHPVQLRIKRVLAQMGGQELRDDARGTDGCGVPTLAMPLTALARAMARLVAPDRLGRLRAEAARRVVAAMTSHSNLVGGRDRFDTLVMNAARGAVVTKGGAEGIHVAALPKPGLGIAIKIDDGAGRAATAVLAALLVRFGELDAHVLQTVQSYIDAPIRNTQDARVGTLRLAPSWLEQ